MVARGLREGGGPPTTESVAELNCRRLSSIRLVCARPGLAGKRVGGPPPSRSPRATRVVRLLIPRWLDDLFDFSRSGSAVTLYGVFGVVEFDAAVQSW